MSPVRLIFWSWKSRELRHETSQCDIIKKLPALKFVPTDAHHQCAKVECEDHSAVQSWVCDRAISSHCTLIYFTRLSRRRSWVWDWATSSYFSSRYRSIWPHFTLMFSLTLPSLTTVNRHFLQFPITYLVKGTHSPQLPHSPQAWSRCPWPYSHLPLLNLPSLVSLFLASIQSP